ncbi:MAG: hypothetical protein M3483_09135 [Gemmatimonadota bacterium]|nr:hypothetical protein [Gemmatimonadota bacterium]
MIWFGSIPLYAPVDAVSDGSGTAYQRMQRALRSVAAREPQLAGDALLAALAATGWIDRGTAARLLPGFRDFDFDRHFAEDLRRISFLGATAGDEFRSRIRRAVEDVVGEAEVAAVGPEEGIRFRNGQQEGVVFAYPEVGFSLGGSARLGVEAAVEEMPDALVIIARNFQTGTAAQLASFLAGTGVPGTLVTVNLLLGMRAVALRYQPSPTRVIATLGAGRPLRSTDVALLGNR